MNSNEDSKRTGNPKNPDVIPASPDVDTGDLVVEAAPPADAPHSENVHTKSEPQARPLGTAEQVKTRRLYFIYGLLTVVAIVATFFIAYYFFFASETVQVVLNSDPPGARVLLDGVEVGTSPVTIMAKPGTHSVIFIQSGFQSFHQTIDIKLDGTVIQQKLLPLSPEP